MRLAQRRARRNKLQNRLVEVEDEIKENDKEIIQRQEAQLIVIQQDLTEDLATIDKESQDGLKVIEANLALEKQEKMMDHEERLKAAGTQKDFNEELINF